jgi:hypothetical protein
MVQAEGSPVRVLDEVDFFNLPIFSSRTIAMGPTDTLVEMSSRNLPGGEKRPARTADKISATCELNV